MGPNTLTIREARDGLQSKKFSSRELVASCLERAQRINPQILAFLELFDEEALATAGAVDRAIARGDALGPLAGIPVAMKDNLLIQGHRASAASRILEPYRASYDSFVTSKLRQAGAIFLGRTNMDEFAMGSSTETSAFGQTKNPWNPKKVPGGSSGGSAAAVAADMALAALGSDTGGSIRQPAALCGIVGLKPTYGRVSRSGLMAMASSFDQIGPLTKTVEDAKIVYGAIIGSDPLDATTVPETLHPRRNPPTSIKNIRVGVPKEYFVSGIDAGVGSSVRDAIKVFERLGAKIDEISLPHAVYGLAVYYILQPAEVSANMSRYDGMRYGRRGAGDKLREVYENSRGEGFGPETRRRIMLGTYVLSSGYYDAYYHKAQQVRTLVKHDFDAAFEHVDVIITPTAPGVAWDLGAKFNDPLTMYLSDIFTVSANVAGVPALSLPCGFSNGLPIGLQLIGRPFDEETLFEVGIAYEAATDWHAKKPNI